MTYRVKITDHAFEQMEEAVNYISRTLRSPDTAKKWLGKLRREIAGLDNMPFRNPLTQEEPWRTEGVRSMLVGNFLVYYWVEEAAQIVWVTAVIYARRDQLMALREMPME